MEIQEVVDRESLEAYLLQFGETDRQAAFRFISARAASRTAPLALSHLIGISLRRNEHPKLLTAFAGLVTSQVALFQRYLGFDAAELASRFAFEAMDRTKVLTSDVAALSAIAFANNVATLSYFSSLKLAEEPAIDAVAKAIDASTTAGIHFSLSNESAWAMVRTDLISLNNDQPVGPLWPDGVVPLPIVTVWASVTEAMQSDQTVGDWTFWIAWYERLLDGKNIHAEKLVPILETLTKEDWLGDPNSVNARFAEVLEIYRAEDAQALVDVTPLAEEVVYDQPLGVLKLEPKDRIAPEYLETILFQIDEAIELFDYPDEAINPLPLSREIKILRSIREKFAHRPVNILKTLGSVVERLDTKIANGECPATDKDADIAHFRRNLSEAMLDLVGFSPEVQDYHNAKKPPVSAENAEELAGLAKKIADFANEALATLLSEAAFTLLDPTVDPYSRRTAQYWIVGVVARTYKIGRQLLKEAKELDDEVKVGIGLVALVTNPKFWEVIGNVIRIFIK